MGDMVKEGGLVLVEPPNLLCAPKGLLAKRPGLPIELVELFVLT